MGGLTLIIASDVQLWWWRGGEGEIGYDANCTGDCVTQHGATANANMVSAMNNIRHLGQWPVNYDLTVGGDIQQPQGIVMNGDLTAYGRDNQLEAYRSFYENQVNTRVWPSLGNHDYANNVNNCGSDFSIDKLPSYIQSLLVTGKPTDQNYCAKQLVKYIRDMLEKGTVPNFGGAVCRYDSASLAYSFELGDWHFVHLNNYPAYSAKLYTELPEWLIKAINSLSPVGSTPPQTWEGLLGEPEVEVSSSNGWLAQDLALATAAHKKSVLFIHDCGDNWKPHLDLDFLKAIQGQNLIAIFAGHLHWDHGYLGYLDTGDSTGPFPAAPKLYEGHKAEYPGLANGYNAPGRYVPLFRSGSADYLTFLFAEFGNSYMNVGVVEATTGQPRFLAQIPNADRDPALQELDDTTGKPVLNEYNGPLLRTYPVQHHFGVYWRIPDAVIYGTPLDVRQLNAVVDVAATPRYNPPAGSVLPAGVHTLTVTFTPDDRRYETESGSVQLTVLKATPTIAWSRPADIVYGTPLTAAELNATATVPGTLTYNPPLGTIMQAGKELALTVTLMPDDSANYNSASAVTRINVLPATPQITWTNPGDIDHGTALDASQLNARASWMVNGVPTFVPGSFAYTPPAGTVLDVGRTQPLGVTFTADDARNYSPASAGVQINVLHGHPILTSATFDPTVLPAGNRVMVTVSITNDSIQPHVTQGPEPGFEYAEGDNFETKEYLPAPGCFRIGVDLAASPYKVDHPYRWGFGKNLAPYESITVTGYIRFHNLHENGQYYIDMLQEVNQVVEPHAGTTGITIEKP